MIVKAVKIIKFIVSRIFFWGAGSFSYNDKNVFLSHHIHTLLPWVCAVLCSQLFILLLNHSILFKKTFKMVINLSNVLKKKKGNKISFQPFTWRDKGIDPTLRITKGFPENEAQEDGVFHRVREEVEVVFQVEGTDRQKYGLMILYVVLGLRSTMWDVKWEIGPLFFSGAAGTCSQPWGELCCGSWCLDGVFLCEVQELQRATVLSLGEPCKGDWGPLSQRLPLCV